MKIEVKFPKGTKQTNGIEGGMREEMESGENAQCTIYSFMKMYSCNIVPYKMYTHDNI